MAAITKEKLIETIKDLPETFSLEDLFERLIFLQKIESGIEQSKSDQVLSTADARAKLSQWLLK
ncbi:MAG: hypothetical protein ACK5RG_22395 [Cyclobacteriaceae bacterium]|jgi:hypothetical protein|nr:hypothetical protein [Flammeovirgaceae bacterium]